MQAIFLMPGSSASAVAEVVLQLVLIVVFVFFPPAICRALCEHAAGPHPDQGQLCGPGGHRGNQGHLPQVPEQVGESTAAFLEAFVCFIITVQQCKPQSV